MPRTIRAARAASAASVALMASVLCGCAGPQAVATVSSPTVARTESQDGFIYARADGRDLRLDACLPDPARVAAAVGGVPAVIVLHGGGFTSGSRSTGGSRTVCRLIADQGLAAFSVDYRLAPARYPAPVEDVQHAIEWLRRPEQVARFGIDPTRIAIFGSSAGAIIGQTVATAGSGPTDVGSRVKAVVSLSGVSDMTPRATRLGTPRPDLVQLVLAYLGCPAVTTCGDAADASAISHVDRTDPPMLLVNGSAEIVPPQQAEAMRAALDEASVPSRLMIVPGDRHGIALLGDRVRTAVEQFLSQNL